MAAPSSQPESRLYSRHPDERIRALTKEQARSMWEYQLPAGGFATPITYEVDGKQYLAIAAGGARGKKPGGLYIAFALK